MIVIGCSNHTVLVKKADVFHNKAPGKCDNLTVVKEGRDFGLNFTWVEEPLV
jgi:hypothetical protein